MEAQRANVQRQMQETRAALETMKNEMLDVAERMASGDPTAHASFLGLKSKRYLPRAC